MRNILPHFGARGVLCNAGCLEDGKYLFGAWKPISYSHFVFWRNVICYAFEVSVLITTKDVRMALITLTRLFVSFTLRVWSRNKYTNKQLNTKYVSC
jgi:hypothetical protein